MTLRQRLYPEARVGGFSRADSTVEFYTRVNSLLRPEMTVVDLGAGRGQFLDGQRTYRQDLQLLRGKVARVIGLDVDPIVQENQSVDEHALIADDGSWPIPDASVDLLLSDWTFEHIKDPSTVAKEARRVMRPGGWICARTPNRLGYISLGARLLPTSIHARVLGKVQPDRQTRDVFPAYYRLNTREQVDRAFHGFELLHYTAFGEPAYFGNSVAAWRTVQAVHRVLPNRFAPISFFFLQRKRD